MKLNEEEIKFVHHWAINYKNAYHAARNYRKKYIKYAYNPKMTIDELTENLEESAKMLAHYKYWHGVMMGMLHAMSYKVRITIYAACSRALGTLTEEAYRGI